MRERLGAQRYTIEYKAKGGEKLDDVYINLYKRKRVSVIRTREGKETRFFPTAWKNHPVPPTTQ